MRLGTRPRSRPPRRTQPRASACSSCPTPRGLPASLPVKTLAVLCCGPAARPPHLARPTRPRPQAVGKAPRASQADAARRAPHCVSALPQRAACMGLASTRMRPHLPGPSTIGNAVSNVFCLSRHRANLNLRQAGGAAPTPDQRQPPPSVRSGAWQRCSPGGTHRAPVEVEALRELLELLGGPVHDLLVAAGHRERARGGDAPAAHGSGRYGQLGAVIKRPTACSWPG
jgi:hypothetical protein